MQVMQVQMRRKALREEDAVSKPKVAFYWCASCGGCEEAVVDLAEDILKVVEAVDIVLWPVALDFKLKDVQKMEDGSIAVSFINGAVRTEEQEMWVKLLRSKSQLVVAFGSCAHLGGIPGLANFSDRASVFKRVYETVPTADNPGHIHPKTESSVDGCSLTLPEFYDTVRALDQVIPVDYYLPGCAPPADLIMNAVSAILKGELPASGSVLAPQKALCDTCPLKDSKPEEVKITALKRIATDALDPDVCYLSQGFVCMGPATRGGCGERCINANMPCRGCFGPTPEAVDLGASALSALASFVSTNDEAEAEKVMAMLPDPAGLFYMYALPSSLLRRKKMEVSHG